jgi:superfamily I DNA/RNA helicase
VSLRNLVLTLGGPGCGKTEDALGIMAREMDAGVPSSRIAFVTYTRKGAEEAKERAIRQFPHLDPDSDFPWFRTIHSLVYQSLGMTREEVMGPRDWKAFSEFVGEDISAAKVDYDDMITATSKSNGNLMLRIIDYAATTLMGLEEAWQSLDDPVDWHELKRFDAALRHFKSQVSKMDFTDMLLAYIQEGEPIDIKVAIIDEGQDLTAAQWAVVYKAFANAERAYVAGDDDQGIYRWAGADVNHFLNLSRSPRVLELSHRLPRRVFNVAQGISSRISRRYVKNFRPSDREGSVEWLVYPDEVDLSSGTWLLLARNQYMLRGLEAVARGQGVNYSMRAGPAINPEDVKSIQLYENLRKGKISDLSAAEVRSLCRALDRPIPQLKELSRYTAPELDVCLDTPWNVALSGIPVERVEYYAECLRRGEKLTAEPRVRIETIHGVKGAQADHVMILSDLSSRTYKGLELEPDHEHRVFYVGVTRAIESLHIIYPHSDRAYEI